MTFRTIGHRGEGRTTITPFAEGKAEEHSLQSFKNAILQGADGAEFDVFITKDFVPVVVHKDNHDDFLISQINYRDLKAFPPPYNQIATLEEVLTLLGELSAKTKDKNLFINVELKGHSVVAPTMKIVDQLASQNILSKEQIFYSSIDRDKLSLVRKLDKNANIQPTIVTTQLYNNAHISLPGYYVPSGTPYNASAIKDLKKYIEKEGCCAIDVPTPDIQEPLITLADKLNVGFCTHPTGPRRIETAGDLYTTIGLLKEFSKHNNVTFKVDDIPQAIKLIETYNSKSGAPVEQLERIMGNHFIKTETTLPIQTALHFMHQ